MNRKRSPWARANQMGSNNQQSKRNRHGAFRRLILMNSEALAKLPFDHNCHSERSEESRIFKRLRSFTSFRMKKNSFASGSFGKRYIFFAGKIPEMI
jgi:hypothetical protein